MIYIVMYLVAIVLANLSSAYFGPNASIVNAFLFIGLDLTARDKLHEAWSGRGLVWKMGVLIAIGSALSLLVNYAIAIVTALPSLPDDANLAVIISSVPSFINPFVAKIAIASMAAFGAAALMDTMMYQLATIWKWSYLQRVNWSNSWSAAVDSLVFPTIAFGGFLPLVTLGQFVAKVFGGAVWSLLLDQKTRCRIGWHGPYDWDMRHQWCKSCKKSWDYNPYLDV